MKDTFYDEIVNWFLDIPIIAYIIVFCVVLMAVPQIRDGVVCLFRLLWPKRDDTKLIIEYADETIVVEEQKRSQYFDVVKIHAVTHFLGVLAEREWLNKRYPGYENCMQKLKHIKTNQGVKTYDVLPIHVGNIKKDVYFDITDFFHGASVTISKDVNKHAEEVIKKMYE